MEGTAEENKNPSLHKMELEEDIETNSVEGGDALSMITKRQDYKWYHVNLSVLPAKLAFIFHIARQVVVHAFLVIFLTAIGLDKVEAGLIAGFRYEYNQSIFRD